MIMLMRYFYDLNLYEKAGEEYEHGHKTFMKFHSVFVEEW